MSFLHDVRRVAQTPGAFANWSEVLLAMAKERVGRGPDELAFATRRGQRITVPNVPGARVPVYEVFAEDCYRLDWFLGDLQGTPIQVVDIGAHVGTFACWLAHLHPQATIDCSEPAPDTCSYLRRNVEQNGLSDRIAVHEQAVAATTGRARLGVPGAASALSSLATDDDAGTGDHLDVVAISFDDAVAGLPHPPVVVKMDCEGGEYPLVRASSPTSWATVQRIVLEYHAVPGERWSELRSWFEDLGFAVAREEPIAEGLGTAWLSRTPLPRG